MGLDDIIRFPVLNMVHMQISVPMQMYLGCNYEITKAAYGMKACPTLHIFFYQFVVKK